VRISPGQCRAARALLGWAQRDLEERSRVSKKAIADFERGASSPQARTIDDLVEAFDAAGIEFLPVQDEVSGLGVRFRFGFDEPSRTSDSDSDGGTPTSGRKPLKGSEDDVSYWTTHPHEWAALSQASRHVLSADMFGDAYAADEAFGT
jgi:transcriptional regulator with XRE-family HTH domain